MKKNAHTIATSAVAACLLLLGSSAWAGAAADSVLLPTVSTAQTGAWIDSFHIATNYAFSTGRPLVMVWSNDICDHCNAFKTSLKKDAFKTWQGAQPYVFCLVEGRSGSDIPANKGAKAFAKNAGGYGKSNSGGYPLVSLLWLKDGEAKAVATFTGRPGKMGVPEQDEMYKEFIEAVETAFAGYSVYSGGKFVVGSTVGDRLEAEQSTEWVDVLVERDKASDLDAASEKLTISYPKATGRATATRNVEWADGESEKRVRIRFADLAGFSFSVGGEVQLALASAEGEPRDESLIALVKRGNSPKNPVWVGKKTAAELAWGEWTMDLDAAKAKVKAEKDNGGAARLLVSFGGSVWCPDCAKTERYLVDTAEFKAWTVANKVACVAIDIPNVNATVESQTGPCLLTREKRNVSAAYSAADPDHGTVQSGAGYLSRWMVSDAAAAEVLARNRKLVGTNTKEGGWNRPERANQYRTGVPVFALVDAATLKVVSRIELFASSSPANAASLAGHIRRFDELLAVEGAADAAFEEDNRDVSTTTAEIAVGGAAAAGEVSGGDLVDMFAVTGVEFDKRIALTATTAASVEWRLSLVQVGDAGAKTVADASGTGKLAVSADLDEADGGKLYAKVELTGLGATAESFGADIAATVAYSLSAASVAKPGSVGFDAATAEAFIPNGSSFSVSVSRTGGRSGAVRARVYLKDAGSAAGQYEFDETVLEWAAGEMGEREVSFEAWRPDDRLASGSFTLGLEILGGDASLGVGSCTVTLSDTSAPSFAKLDIETGAHLTFKASEDIPLMNVVAGKSATLKKTSGSLPNGMRLSYNRKNGTVTLSGTPKKAGVYTATYTMTQNGETGLPATITITVDDPEAVNPFVGVKRSAQTVPLLEELPNGTNVVAGTLTISITAANKVTVKLQTLDGSSSSCSGKWSDFDAATGVVSATLTARDGTVVALEMDASGTIRADLNGGEQYGEIAAPTADFRAWAGSYTVTFPEDPSETGDASMAFATVTIATNGTVKWSATLSNSQAASGSSQLFGREGEFAHVALFKSSKSYAFSSLLKVRRGGGGTWTDQAKNQIIHNAPGTATYESVGSVETLRAAFGGWWTPNAAPTDVLAAFGYVDELSFESEAFDDRSVLATRSGFTLDAVVRGDRLSYTKKTGAFSGSISIPGADGKTVKATVKGVLLPGWDDCGCVEPGEGEEALVTRPFGAGIAYYKVRAGGASTTVSVPVYLRTSGLAE